MFGMIGGAGMGFGELFAVILALAAALAYAFMIFKKYSPYLKQTRRISGLKESSDLVRTTAEIIGVEKRDLNGLKVDICKLYVMRVQYQSEIASRRVEHTDIIFVNEPPERAGQNIDILYSRKKPSDVMTVLDRESKGFGGVIMRIIIGILITFVICWAVFYCLCKYGLPDD